MGGLNVKITILERLFGAVAPDLCYSCGKIGASFCHYCKYDITHEFIAECFWCGVPSGRGVCSAHDGFIEHVFMLGHYEDGLKKSLEGLKFQRDKYIAKKFAQDLDTLLPALPKDIVVVPVPTLTRNIRKRGYDHVSIVASTIGKIRGYEVQYIVERCGATVQHDTETRKERQAQVTTMFSLKGVDIPEVILLIDDIITTGSTVNEIARQLRQAGAQHVIVAAIARTP